MAHTGRVAALRPGHNETEHKLPTNGTNVERPKSAIVTLRWAHSCGHSMTRGDDKEQAASMHRLAQFRFFAITSTSSISVVRAC